MQIPEDENAAATLPRLWGRLVSFVVPRRIRDEVLDELADQFEQHRLSRGAMFAKRAYRRQALCISVRYITYYVVDVAKTFAFLYRVSHWVEKLLDYFRPFLEILKELLRL